MSDEAVINVPQDLVEAVWLGWVSVLDASTLGQQASAIERLSNDMSDLITWSPSFDVERGELREPA